MDLTIKTANNQNLVFVPSVSSGEYFNLPCSNFWYAETEHGQIYFQEKQAGPFTIRLSLLLFIRKITLYFSSQTPKAGVRIDLKSGWNVGLPGEKTVKVRKNQFVLFSPRAKREKMVFEKDQPYRGIKVLCGPRKLYELMDLFPGISKYVGGWRTQFHFPAKKAHMGSRQSVGYGERTGRIRLCR
jgi:hypothetical protein